MRARRIALGSAGALLAGSLVVAGGAPSYAIDGDECLDINEVGEPGENDVTQFAADGSPASALQVPATQQRVTELTGRVAGDGVTVAVLDSGVLSTGGLLDVERGQPAPGATRTSDLVWHQGTLLAGIIAGAPDADTGLPVGIAPGAAIYDQRIYDTGADDDELTQVDADALADGLDAIAPRVGKDGIRIVTVGVRVPADTPRLREAVERVTERGAILVAASGQRTDPDEESPQATFRAGEDGAESSWPAGYSRQSEDGDAIPGVLSVTTTGAHGDGGDDATLQDLILFSSAIDVAAPSRGAVSVALNGRYCSTYVESTAVAAAEVSGVLALLMTAYPKDRREQIITRLEATASGATRVDPATPNTRVGRGVIQPYEALTRPLSPDRRGNLPFGVPAEQEAVPAQLPEAAPDVLASTRDNAVWWGLLGGGALVVLALLRPVLARRR
jgi:membrane-anchored mycosin MYCP